MDSGDRCERQPLRAFVVPLLSLLMAQVAPVCAATGCVGDCFGDGAVTVDEISILTAVSIGARPVEDCHDPNTDGVITIEEIVGAVGNSLNGCPRLSDRYLYPGPQVRSGVPVTLADVNDDGAVDIVSPGSILLNDRRGSFRASPFVSMFGDDLTLADFDEDGRVDFAVVSRSEDILKVQLSGPPASRLSLMAGRAPTAVASGDIDGDGHQDLVAASPPNRELYLYLGAGDGTFVLTEVFLVDRRPALLEVADVSDDGKDEILVSTEGPPRLTILRRGESEFIESVAVIEPSGAEMLAQVLVRDTNADGNLDLLLVGSDGGEFSVWLGNGDGTFRRGPPAEIAAASAIAVGDFNGDGVDDMAIGTLAETGEIGIALGERGRPGIDSTFATGEPVRGLAAADLTGDGKVDLAMTASDGLTIFEGNGDGTFQASRRAAYPPQAGYKIAHLDADTTLDVLGFQYDFLGLRSFLRSADGGFEDLGVTPIAPHTGPPLSVSEWLAFGDFDADGSNDFAFVRPGDNEVHLFWGAGDGTFSGAQPAAVGGIPRSVATADVDGDGRDDVITANYESDDVTLLLSKGNRQFESRTLTAGDGPLQIAIGDIEGDGAADLILGNVDSKDLSIRLAGADHSFSVEKRLRFAGESGLRTVIAHDLNNDDFVDLVAVGLWDFAVLVGAGDGTFRSPRLYPALNVFGEVQVADANGDGKLDLFVRDLFSTVGIWLGDGRGEFVGPLNFSVGANVDEMVAADVNGDGVPDLLTGSFTGGFATTLGAGCAEAPGYALGYPQWLAIGLIAPVVVDLNGDGRPDLVGGGAEAAYVALASATGEIGLPTAIPDSEASSSVEVGDLDGDGNLDVVIANPTTDSVSVCAGVSGGSFGPCTRVPVGDEPVKVHLADFNGDTRTDIAVLNDGDKSVRVLLRTVAGEYESVGDFDAQYMRFGGDRSGGLISGDFDRNGTMDLIFPHASGVGILLGFGDGRFAPVRAAASMSSSARQIVVGDYDEDGFEDLATTNRESSDVTISLGHGDGTFTPSQRVFASVGAAGIDTADVDGDGHLDHVVTSYNTGPHALSVLFGRGDGTFPTRREFPGTYFVDSVRLTDFDSDGDVDAIITSGSGVLAQAGMLVPCARFHDTGSNGPFVRCSLDTPEGTRQTLTCDDPSRLGRNLSSKPQP